MDLFDQGIKVNAIRGRWKKQLALFVAKEPYLSCNGNHSDINSNFAWSAIY